tara:strand:- start:2081 stop:2635 length:555 start_codon:yes stop_codon:yes gene_type:complete
MLNKLFAIILLHSPNVFLCTELNNLNLYKSSTQTISLDFIQSFENSERSFVKGQIFYERPNLFKISTSKPTKTDLIVNGTEAFRTDYQLNETIQYELRKIESQIPALLLLKSKKKVCNFLKKSEQSEFISDVKVISENENLKKITYKDQFGIKTEINFQKIKINVELDRKLFDYNKQTTLVILN